MTKPNPYSLPPALLRKPLPSATYIAARLLMVHQYEKSRSSDGEIHDYCALCQTSWPCATITILTEDDNA